MDEWREPPPREAQAQTLLASIVQSSHDAIVAISLDMEILSWNPGAERLYGYAAKEIVGRHLDLLLPPGSCREHAREVVAFVSEGGRLDRFRTRWVRADGSLVSISLTVSPLTDPQGTIVGVATMARDITDRERLEARLGAVLDAAPDAIIAVAPDNRVVLANGRAEQLFGRPIAEIMGHPVDVLVPEGLSVTAEPARRRPADEASVSAVRLDGERVPVEITVSVADTDEGPVRCAVLRDVTERMHAEVERARLQEEAEKVRLEARLQRTQRMESLGQLAGGVAHDFNNLIGVILSYAEFIADEAEGSGDCRLIAEDARQILRAARRGSDLTHQLLSFARREVISTRVLDLNLVIRDVGQMLRRALGEHIRLSMVLAENLPAITADPGQLEQVLVNLAVNARDAMPSGGQLTLETAVLDVDDEYAAARPLLRPQRYVRLRVSDTGVGMTRETIDRAFEPFFTTKPSGEGTGLGLATVYGIITQANGDVQIYSEPGMGTTISILLPVCGQSPAKGGSAQSAPVTSARGETILVAEDETALRDVVVRVLSSAGYQVLAADSGPAALERAAMHTGPIQLLVTDAVMPGMLGRDLARQLTTIRPEARVLFVSGYARPVLAANGGMASDVALLEKPFSRAELLTAVRARLDG